MPRSRWTAAEVRLLLQYRDRGLQIAQELPRRSQDAITSAAWKLGLRSKDRFRRFRKTIPASG
jgi:hypothetical protein